MSFQASESRSVLIKYDSVNLILHLHFKYLESLIDFLPTYH